MKFLNYNKVLCLSPHPDDVEYGMLGTICKYKNTQFDIVVLSQGGDFDQSTAKERQNECKKIWENHYSYNPTIYHDNIPTYGKKRLDCKPCRKEMNGQDS